MTQSVSSTHPNIVHGPHRDGDDARVLAGCVVELDPRLDLVAVIATMLADTRRRAGLTQRQLGSAAGVGHSMIAAY